MAFVMLDYNGIKCPVCGVPFREEDDVVVCPECGAPYHRECYHQAGECIFEDLHRTGEEWTPPAEKQPPSPADSEIKDRECPSCGLLNAHSMTFCSRCGAYLLPPYQQQPPEAPKENRQSSPAAPPFTPQPPVRPGSSFGGRSSPFYYDPMGGVSPADELEKGVTFGDASKLVRTNTNYYMPVFRYIKQTGRNKFNFCAFLFSGAWMLYRKQYKYGAFVTSLMFVLYLAYQGSMLLVSYPTMTALATQLGYDPTQMYLFTEEQYMAISTLAMQSSWDMLKISLPFLILVLILACMIVIGVRGNKMYLNHCVATVREINAQSAAGDPNMTLQACGGVNSMASLCVAIAYFVLRTILMLLPL